MRNIAQSYQLQDTQKLKFNTGIVEKKGDHYKVCLKNGKSYDLEVITDI